MSSHLFFHTLKSHHSRTRIILIRFLNNQAPLSDNMKNKMVKKEMHKFIHISTIVVLLTIMVVGVGCNTPSNSKSPESVVEHGCDWSETLPESRPSDFNIIFKYGYGTVNNRNILNTFNGTYTKDLGRNPSVTIDFSLSDEDMDRIYQKMLEIDFLCYPNKFVIIVPDGESVAMRSPYLEYYFQVVCNQRIKVLKWEDTILNVDEDAKNLRSLIDLVRSTIESKAEYRSLPSPVGAVS